MAVSIFVNPLQFEPGSDFERYPRPESDDEEFCRKAGVDLLFRPAPKRNVCADRSVFVEETSLANALCGNRGLDIFAASARSWRSFSTSSHRTRRFSAKRIFSNWRSFVGWCAI